MSRFTVLAVALIAALVVLAACVPLPAPQSPSTGLDEARAIAAHSECAQAGQIMKPAVYNENSGTWWIQMEANKPGCNPACVVDLKTKTAVVNWRCTGLKVEPTGAAGIANPASANCGKQGGVSTIETQPEGGQYGVCSFPNGKQCEEWALLRGTCPVGGVDVKGYATAAGRYCAITGGTYTATANQGAADEAGTCTLQGGKACDAGEYYAGTCTAQ
jgi:putative hemolysin